MQKEELSLAKKYLGYKEYGDFDINALRQLYSFNSPFKGLNLGTELGNLRNISTLSLEELKSEAISFYRKYFSVHPIDYLDLMTLDENKDDILSSTSVDEAHQKFVSLCSKMSPFDIPISKKADYCTFGNIKKSVVLSKELADYENRIVPFDSIELGGPLNRLSIATYIHQIGYSQLESNIGFSSIYLHKGVISIFLEKLAALELDPTGELLKKQERTRFAYIYRMICFALIGQASKEDYMQIYSSLLAEKLFDNYMKEKSDANRRKYIYDIQDVFDGKTTVEDLLGKQNVNINNAKSTSMIKSHL